MSANRAILAFSRTCLPVLVAIQTVGFFSAVSPAAAAPTPAPVHVQVTEVFPESEFLALTNAERAAHGVAPLRLDPELVSAAEAKDYDMDTKDYWDHFRPGDNKAPWDFIDEAGYDYRVAGENLARGFRTPEGVTKAWMNSPAHRANLLSPKYTDVGFASIISYDTGSPVLLTVQMFGAR